MPQCSTELKKNHQFECLGLISFLFIITGCSLSKVENPPIVPVKLPNIYFEQTSKTTHHSNQEKRGLNKSKYEELKPVNVSNCTVHESSISTRNPARRLTFPTRSAISPKAMLRDTTKPIEIQVRASGRPVAETTDNTKNNNETAIAGLVMNGLVFAVGLGLLMGVGLGLGPGQSLYWFFYILLGLLILTVGFFITLAGFFKMKKKNSKRPRFGLTLYSALAWLGSLLLMYLTISY